MERKAVILIVDDEEEVRSMVGEFLTRRGYQVRFAADGQAALTAVAEELPDLIVLDLYMPVLDGLATLRELRARGYRGGVILLTASQDEALLQQSLDLDSVDLLVKPVNLEHLVSVIQDGLAA